MRKKSGERVWWKSFSTADQALAALIFPAVFFDGPGEGGLEDPRERLRAWKFNLKKFDSTLTPKQREFFSYWIGSVEHDIVKAKAEGAK
jgi:hypothetical protein